MATSSDSPLRIALLTPGFSASEDDWCIPVQLDFVRRLSRRHEVTVFPLRYPHHRRPYRVGGARVLPAGGAGVRGPARLLLFRRVLDLIRGEHRRRPFDVLHAFWAHEPGFLAVRAGRRLGVPAVVSLMGGELADVPEAGYGGARELVNPHLTRHALASAARVVAGSRFVDEMAAREVEAARRTLLPLGVDVERFSPDGAAAPLEGSPRLLHVASLIPVKDQTTLLEAFAAVATELPEACLHVVGDGPLRPRLGALADSLGIAARVHWHGAVPHDELPAFYRAADVCVLASRFEAFAMVVLEAAACGRLTLGTAVGKLPELVDSARLAAPGEAAALGRRLIEALRDPESLAADGRALRRRLVEEMPIEVGVEAHVALYRRLTPSPSPSGRRGERPGVWRVLRCNLAQLALLALDALPDAVVAHSYYPSLRRLLSSTPVRFEPSGLASMEMPASRWPGRRLASRNTDLVIDGFPGSANSFVSNGLRRALRRPANVESHFHYTAQLRRSLALGVPAIVLVRRPADACRSLLGKESALWSWLAVWRWLAYHRWVLRHRRQLGVVFFDQVTRDFDSLRRRHAAVARLVNGPLEGPVDLRRPSAKRRELGNDPLTRWLLNAARRLYDRLCEVTEAGP